MADTKVQETADDAALSKVSAVRLGYIADPFISLFVKRPQRRSPLINRGYFARMSAVDLILKRFVAIARRTGDGHSQVVSLGAGMDSTFFRAYINSTAPTTYFELDFPDVTTRKAAIIRDCDILKRCVAGKHVSAGEVADLAADLSKQDPLNGSIDFAMSPVPSLSSTLPNFKSGPSPPVSSTPRTSDYGVTFTPSPAGGCDVYAPQYRLGTADLRDLAGCRAALVSLGIDFNLPTLFLSECVLVYLEPEYSCSVIAWAAQNFPRSAFVTYEQIRPHDAFGQMMARNLESRGYSLRGLHTFPDLNSQTQRYRELGFSHCTVADMNDIYYHLLPRSEVARAERLEIFDELEEWHLMSSHYCIAVAVNETTPNPVQRKPKSRRRGESNDKILTSDDSKYASNSTSHPSPPFSSTPVHGSSDGSAQDSSRSHKRMPPPPSPSPSISLSQHSDSGGPQSLSLSGTPTRKLVDPLHLAAAVVRDHENSSCGGCQHCHAHSLSHSSQSSQVGFGDRDVNVASTSASVGRSRSTSHSCSRSRSSSVISVGDIPPSTAQVFTANSSLNGSVGGVTSAVSVGSSYAASAAALVDRIAIAESEEEIDHARILRETAGIDLELQGALPFPHTHRGIGKVSHTPGVVNMTSAEVTQAFISGVRIDTSNVTMTADSSSTNSSTPLSTGSSATNSVHTNSNSNSSTGNVSANSKMTSKSYDVDSILSSEHPVSLRDLLFPLNDWKLPTHSSAHRSIF